MHRRRADGIHARLAAASLGSKTLPFAAFDLIRLRIQIDENQHEPLLRNNPASASHDAYAAGTPDARYCGELRSRAVPGAFATVFGVLAL